MWNPKTKQKRNSPFLNTQNKWVGGRRWAKWVKRSGRYRLLVMG